MVSLWFAELDDSDRVSVKPHASPVLHAFNYLLDDLDGRPDHSSRQGESAVLSEPPPGSGHRGLLDGVRRDRCARRLWPRCLAIWEAVADPAVATLGELLWIVDLNRQSLDRVVPEIQIERLQGMFAAAGWQVVTLKWGRSPSCSRDPMMTSRGAAWRPCPTRSTSDC